MHDNLNLENFFSLCLGKTWQQVQVRRVTDWSASQLFEMIQQSPETVWVLMGYDHGEQGSHVPLDRLLESHKGRYKVFLTYSDHIKMHESTKNLKNFYLIPVCHLLLAHISCLSIVKTVINRSFSTDGHGQRWLSLNRQPRKHRQYLVESWLSKHDDLFHYTYGQSRFFGNYGLWDAAFGNNPPNPPEISNVVNLFKLTDLYNSTCASIVTETMAISSVTEKTIHAFLSLHPVIMVGHPGTVRYLRNQGFDMFDDIIDHDYDDVEDYRERIDHMMKSNWALFQSGLDRHNLDDRLKYNRDHVWRYYDNSLDMISRLMNEKLKQIENQ